MMRFLSKTLPFFLMLALPALAWPGTAKLAYTLAVYVDSHGEGMMQPGGVSCDGSSFWVADSGNRRLLNYSLQNKVASPTKEIIFADNPPKDALNDVYPVKIHQNSKGDLFVLDGKYRRILHLDSDGGFKNVVEAKGLPGKVPVIPKSFVIDKNDNLLILDIFSSRILLLDPQGKYFQQIAFPPTYGFFSDLAVNSKGDLFLLDSVKKAVLQKASGSETFSAMSEELIEYMNFPTSITTDAKGRIFLVDQYGSGIVILSQEGAYLGRQLGMGWNESFLYYPSDACITEENDFVIADRNNNRVQVYKLVEK